MASSDSNSQGPIFWDRLRSLFMRDERSEEGRQERPYRPEVIVLICLVISCVLWFTFKLQEVYTVAFELPTRVINVPEGQALAALPPQQVRVQVQGTGLQLLQLKFTSPTVPINAARNQVDLMTIARTLPADIAVESVSPRLLELAKEPRVTRRVPIRLRAQLETPATHDLIAPPRIEPDSVTVSGARSIVEGLEYWPTDSLVVSDLTDSLAVHVPLADTLGSLVTHSLQQVQVRAPVQQFTEGVRTLDVRVVGAPGRVVTLEPSSIEVRYRVPVTQYEASQQTAGFFATVSYEAIRTDTNGRVRPEVHLPIDLEIRDLRVSPSTLEYYNFIELNDDYRASRP